MRLQQPDFVKSSGDLLSAMAQQGTKKGDLVLKRLEEDGGLTGGYSLDLTNSDF